MLTKSYLSWSSVWTLRNPADTRELFDASPTFCFVGGVAPLLIGPAVFFTSSLISLVTFQYMHVGNVKTTNPFFPFCRPCFSSLQPTEVTQGEGSYQTLPLEVRKTLNSTVWLTLVRPPSLSRSSPTRSVKHGAQRLAWCLFIRYYRKVRSSIRISQKPYNGNRKWHWLQAPPPLSDLKIKTRA